MELLTLKEYFEMGIPDIEYFKTGSYCFDNIVGGITQGAITILAGASGNGKSNVALHLASLLSKNYKVLYLSVENSIQVDIKRFKKAKEIYNVPVEKITYVNFSLEEDKYGETLKKCINIIPNNDYDIVFIDGAIIALKTEEEGGKMYAQGDRFMELLHKIFSNTGMACILTWQLNRQGMGKTIDDIDIDNIANSVSIVQYASQVYAIKRRIKNKNAKESEKNKSDWCLKLLKTRSEANWDESTINILDDNNNINLKYYDDSCECVNELKRYITEEK